MSNGVSHPYGIAKRTTEIWAAASVATLVEGAVVWAPAYSRKTGLLLPQGEFHLLECCGIRRYSKSGSLWIDKRQVQMYRDHLPPRLLSRLAYVLPHPQLGRVLDELIDWPGFEPWLKRISEGLYAVRFKDVERHIAHHGRGTLKEKELEELLTSPSIEAPARPAAEALLSYFRDWAPFGGGVLQQEYQLAELEADGFMWFGPRPTPLVVVPAGH